MSVVLSFALCLHSMLRGTHLLAECEDAGGMVGLEQGLLPAVWALFQYAVGAADILDHRSCIRCVSKETRREFWQVSQKAKQTYCVIPGWCSCQSYSFEVLGSRNKLVCKHELAVMLATALGLGHTNELDEEKWAAELDLATRFSLNAHGGA